MVTHDLGEDAPGGRRVLVQQMLQGNKYMRSCRTRKAEIRG